MKHLLPDVIEASNKLTLRYRNTIAFPALMHKETETPVRPETILSILTEARTLQEYGYYIHPLDIITMIRCVVTEEDGRRVFFSLTTADEYLAEVTGATRTYTTLYGVNVTAEDLKKTGVDPYMVQYVHYTLVALGVDDHDSYNILDNSASEQAAEAVSKAITNKQHPDQKENLEEMMNALVNNIEGKERLFISFDMINDATAIFTELIGSNNPMSDTMKSDVRRFLEYVASDIEDWDKKELKVPCKETFAMLVYEYLRFGFNATNLAKNINNATDVLRAFAIYSDPLYDGSLSTKPKFKNHLSHDERKFFMMLLTYADHIGTDVFLYPEFLFNA